MAHFAELDENNVVTNIIVVHNNELLVDGIESETKGIEFCQSLFGGNWIQTSYNGTIRKRFAGIGMVYDLERSVFRTQQPLEYPSWVLTNDGTWVPPIPYPSDATIDNENPLQTKMYNWDEASLSWVLLPYIDPLLTAEEGVSWQ